MDSVQKAWMFYNWMEDRSDDYELSENNALTIASFINPEAVDKIVSGKGKHVSTDEEFEETSRMIKEQNVEELGFLSKIKEEELSRAKKRKRKILTKSE